MADTPIRGRWTITQRRPMTPGAVSDWHVATGPDPGRHGRIEVVPVPDEAAKERAHIALCRFVFPHYLVPREDMAAAVLAAAHDYGEDWMDRLPAKRIAQGPPWPDEAAIERGAKAARDAYNHAIDARLLKDLWPDVALAVLRAALDPDARPETPEKEADRG